MLIPSWQTAGTCVEALTSLNEWKFNDDFLWTPFDYHEISVTNKKTL